MAVSLLRKSSSFDLPFRSYVSGSFAGRKLLSALRRRHSSICHSTDPLHDKLGPRPNPPAHPAFAVGVFPFRSISSNYRLENLEANFVKTLPSCPYERGDILKNRVDNEFSVRLCEYWSDLEILVALALSTPTVARNAISTVFMAPRPLRLPTPAQP